MDHKIKFLEEAQKKKTILVQTQKERWLVILHYTPPTFLHGSAHLLTSHILVVSFLVPKFATTATTEKKPGISSWRFFFRNNHVWVQCPPRMDATLLEELFFAPQWLDQVDWRTWSFDEGLSLCLSHETCGHGQKIEVEKENLKFDLTFVYAKKKNT